MTHDDVEKILYREIDETPQATSWRVGFDLCDNPDIELIKEVIYGLGYDYVGHSYHQFELKVSWRTND